MAEDPRTYQSSTVQANRNLMQGGGSGQKDMDLQQSPNRDQHATDPQNTEGWDNDPPNQATDRPAEADFSGQDVGEARSFQSSEGSDSEAPDRDDAAVDDSPILGSGTPANVDIHNIGQQDNPEGDWGEAEPGAVFSSNHTRRPDHTEADRGQGPKTRQLNKDINSGRA